MTSEPVLTLNGTLRLSDCQCKRTAKNFSRLINENSDVFRRHFGVDLFPGSLNVDIRSPPSLQNDLDAGRPAPAFVIPRSELNGMPDYIGDGQAWQCVLSGAKFPKPIDCWIFRRKGSKVPCGVIEIVAPHPALCSTFGLKNGDPVSIAIF
jgi:CTP-dependent riboflavin kinase